MKDEKEEMVEMRIIMLSVPPLGVKISTGGTPFAVGRDYTVRYNVLTFTIFQHISPDVSPGAPILLPPSSGTDPTEDERQTST